MDVLQESELLKLNPNTLQVVRKEYELDKPGAMKNAIDILNKWIQTQPHFLKKDFSPEYLERMIISCKGSVERSKERLDKLLTVRTTMPKFFENFDPQRDFQNIKGIIYYVPLPKMTEENDRIIFIRVAGKKFSPELYHEGFRYCLLICEYFAAHDYALSYHVVIDYLDANITELVKRVDLVDMRQAIFNAIEGFGVRVKGVYILVNSAVVDVIVAIAKQVASEKIGKRIHTLKSYEQLYERLPRKLFPNDFGGEDKPLDELDAICRKQILSKEFKEYWMMMTSAKTDEALRPVDKFNDQYLGMPGTFRVLSVD
ncbi:CRAL/TRIO domain-containing protein [Phthorimaea operculella]|nr:CRAL/TRIO domain-containing protein [Phthorimaea operculella]